MMALLSYMFVTTFSLRRTVLKLASTNSSRKEDSKAVYLRQGQLHYKGT